MKIDPKHKLLLWSSLGSVIALFAPWIVYLVIKKEPFDAENLIELMVIPVLGVVLVMSEMAYDLAPEWFQDTVLTAIEYTIYGTTFLIFIWTIPVAALLWAMTILGVRGKWWLTAVVTIGLAFEIISVSLFPNL